MCLDDVDRVWKKIRGQLPFIQSILIFRGRHWATLGYWFLQENTRRRFTTRYFPDTFTLGHSDKSVPLCGGSPGLLFPKAVCATKENATRPAAGIQPEQDKNELEPNPIHPHIVLNVFPVVLSMAVIFIRSHFLSVCPQEHL